MNTNVNYKLNSDECGMGFTLKLIGGKWKPLILWTLSENGTQRNGEIRRFIPSITNKMLAQSLRELEDDGLISRKDYKTTPPRVEYTITEKGKSLDPILDLMCVWGFEHDPSLSSCKIK